MRSLNFTSHQCYFNPSRISPDQVDVDSRKRIIVPGSEEQTAVFFTAGIVAACNLQSGHDISGRAGDTPCHRKDICIWCYHQEYELLTSFFAAVYKVNRLCGPIMGSSLVVSTRKEGAQGANQWADSCKNILSPYIVISDYWVSCCQNDSFACKTISFAQKRCKNCIVINTSVVVCERVLVSWFSRIRRWRCAVLSPIC